MQWMLLTWTKTKYIEGARYLPMKAKIYMCVTLPRFCQTLPLSFVKDNYNDVNLGDAIIFNS